MSVDNPTEIIWWLRIGVPVVVTIGLWILKWLMDIRTSLRDLRRTSGPPV